MRELTVLAVCVVCHAVKHICCVAIVLHPNLVRLMGYVTKPRLYIVQEFMSGQALDKQLYVEGWQPTASQIVQAALGVARGMEFLHTSVV